MYAEKCFQPVCNFGCSIQDPLSYNKMHRIHKKSDKRCLPSEFDCESCERRFKNKYGLQNHVDTKHTEKFECPICERKCLKQEGLQEQIRKEHDYLETTSPSLLSEASSGWMNTADLSKYEELLIQSYVETEELSISLEMETNKRIKQNLKDVNFEEDSNDDVEYNQTVEECNEAEVELDHNKAKRKREEKSIIPSIKKKSDDLICDVCMSKFTRKDNLKRHYINEALNTELCH